MAELFDTNKKWVKIELEITIKNAIIKPMGAYLVSTGFLKYK